MSDNRSETAADWRKSLQCQGSALQLGAATNTSDMAMIFLLVTNCGGKITAINGK